MTFQIAVFRGRLDPHSDAVSRSLVELLAELQKRGFSCHIYAAEQSVGDISAIESGGVTIHTLGHNGAGGYGFGARLAFLFRCAGVVLRYRKQWSAVVSMEDPTGLSLVIGVILFLLRSPIRHYAYLMDMQSIQTLALGRAQGRSTVLLWLRVALDVLGWRLTTTVVLLGNCMSKVARSYSVRRTVVLPIWQDGRRLIRNHGLLLRNQLGLKDELVVVYHGYAGDRHPLEFLPEVANKLTQAGVHFIVQATGSSIEALKIQCRLSKPINLTIAPDIDSATWLDYLSLGDVHLISLDERATGTCVPSKTYSAMALGSPCLYVGDPSGQAAIDVVTSHGGFVYRADQVDKLVESLTLLSSNRNLLRQLGRNARHFFECDRDLVKVADRWEIFLLSHGSSI